MNLQNLLNYIDDNVKVAQKEQRYAEKRNDSEFSYWKGYEESLLMLRVRVLKKIQDKKEKKDKKKDRV